MLRQNWFPATALVALLAGFAFAEGPSPPAGWSDGYILANGIRIHYWRTGGNKPPMVLAHGSSDDGLCWTNLAKELEGNFDLILMDARGHGLSDPPSVSDPADAQVEDLAGLIRELKLVKPILMGHSMGSASVAWFAAKYPDIPRAIVLEDPGLGPGAPAVPAPLLRPVIANNGAPASWRATTGPTPRSWRSAGRILRSGELPSVSSGPPPRGAITPTRLSAALATALRQLSCFPRSSAPR